MAVCTDRNEGSDDSRRRFWAVWRMRGFAYPSGCAGRASVETEDGYGSAARNLFSFQFGKRSGPKGRGGIRRPSSYDDSAPKCFRPIQLGDDLLPEKDMAGMAADDPNIEREGQTQYAPFMKDSEMEKNRCSS